VLPNNLSGDRVHKSKNGTMPNAPHEPPPTDDSREPKTL
jgi:hypothetical protein